MSITCSDVGTDVHLNRRHSGVSGYHCRSSFLHKRSKTSPLPAHTREHDGYLMNSLGFDDANSVNDKPEPLSSQMSATGQRTSSSRVNFDFSPSACPAPPSVLGSLVHPSQSFVATRIPASMSRRRLASNIPALHSKVDLPPPPTSWAVSSPSDDTSRLPDGDFGPPALLFFRRGESDLAEFTDTASSPVTPVEQIMHTPIEPPSIGSRHFPKSRKLAILHLSLRSDLSYESLCPLDSPDLPFTPLVDEGIFIGPSTSLSPIVSAPTSTYPSIKDKIGLGHSEEISRSSRRCQLNPILARCSSPYALCGTVCLPVSRRLSYHQRTSSPSTPTPIREQVNLASPAIIRSMHFSDDKGSSDVCGAGEGIEITPVPGKVPGQLSLCSTSLLVEAIGYFGV
ncbi:uncharacterized protein FIBRA_06063 [Fibroporia radiculosa]|uniref:Uncharacterized protein n=1 Tax=Fibroporia radiculosa TaxID=599839 RepID=J4HYJ2_9APHY|nr:uncharacterized protein FIBRA_06063 [Fibroporia radiculosa]CCM03912.1 predicted protein [Fibroporia radiculosa]